MEVHMKKIKFLFLVFTIFVLFPMTVIAKDKINVYLFKGEGCGYCANALSFFNSLDDEYQSYFQLVEKEVWHNSDNNDLMQKVASHFELEVKGVPFIVVGNIPFRGYDSSFDEDIKRAIKESYENTDGSYQDVVASLANDSSDVDKKAPLNDTAITIIILIAAVAGIGFLIYMARDEK